MMRTTDLVHAIAIVGKRARKADLARMHFALSLHPWNNSEEEEARRVAALYVLRHWSDYREACQS